MGAGNDHLYGLKGNDTLNGGAGDDWIEGGKGMTRSPAALELTLFREIPRSTKGPSGNNRIKSERPLHLPLALQPSQPSSYSRTSPNVDTITDFQEKVDHIALDHNIFTNLTKGELVDSTFCSGATAQGQRPRDL